jgi:hypothetical protein
MKPLESNVYELDGEEVALVSGGAVWGAVVGGIIGGVFGRRPVPSAGRSEAARSERWGPRTAPPWEPL